jgi:hypothetical protein
MYGLTIRWSLADALRVYVHGTSLERFTRRARS